MVRDLLSRLGDVFDRRIKRRLLLAILGSLIVSVLDTAAIALVLPLVQLATGGADTGGVIAWISGHLGDPDRGTLTIYLTVAVVVLFILKDLGQMAFTWWLTGFVFVERVRTSARLLGHVLTSPFTESSRRSSAELIRVVDGAVMQVFNYTVSGLMTAASNAIAIGAIVVALLLVAPLPTLVVVAYFGVASIIFVTLVKPRAVKAGVVMTEASVAGWRTALAAIGGIKELNLRGSQLHFVERYEAAALLGARSGRTASFLGSLPKYVLEILFIIAVGLILLVGVTTSADGGGALVGMLALFVAAGFRILPSITGLLASVSNIRVGDKALDIVRDEVLAARDRGPLAAPTGERVPLERELCLEGITFRYPGSEVDVLTDINLRVPRGSMVAFVGGSGAGKTTLIDILLGLHRPASGRVTADGVDIATSRAGWGRGIGYVPQDVFILDATLAENIAFDLEREAIDEAALLRAIGHAQLDDVVAALPDGIDTQLGEKGSRLSGGQRQRIGIARALYTAPQLLVLDEATSALDNETEHRISTTLTSLLGELTIVVVAHRLSTVREADQIVFLSGGRVETTGSFEEVRLASDEFARLVELGSLQASAVLSSEQGAATEAVSPGVDVRTEAAM